MQKLKNTITNKSPQLPPSIDKNYIIKEMIGQGQFGKVYRADAILANSQPVAIKIISNHKFRKNQKLKTLIQNQMEVLTSLHHPNIIQFLQFAIGQNEVYMIYELCEGGTLEDRAPLSEKQLIPLMLQIIEAFVASQKLNILHRDIKPANILFKNGKIKVADWGFSRFLDQGQTTLSFIGSPAYMSPQVLKSEQYTIKADVWSLGVMLYEIMCSRCPWNGKNVSNLIKQVSKKHLQFPQNIKISKDMKKIILCMLKFDKDQRSSFREIQQMLFKITEQKINRLVLTEIRPKTQNFQRKKTSSLLNYTFFLQMIQITKRIATSSKNLILFFKLIEENLKKINVPHQQEEHEFVQIMNRQAKIVEQMRSNLQRSHNMKSVDILKTRKSSKVIKDINNPESSNKKRKLNQTTSKQLNSKIIKQVISYILENLQSVLTLIKSAKKISTSPSPKNESSKAKLIELNCMLDLIVYRQIPQQYNIKSAKTYLNDLNTSKESLLIKLLNHKLILVNQKYFQ